MDGGSAPPRVRLVREFKGLTVADLLRDEIVDRLPGQVRSVLHHVERGDFATAERMLPGDFAPVLPGPTPKRSAHRLWIALALVGAVVTAAALTYWLVE